MSDFWFGIMLATIGLAGVTVGVFIGLLIGMVA